MSYRINVKTVKGDNLTFRGVSSYQVKDGFLHFIDEKTNKPKIFAVANTEIEVEE